MCLLDTYQLCPMYTSVDHKSSLSLVLLHGRGALLVKADIKEAYGHMIPIHLGD